jgi:hypothetical protein
MNEPKPADGVQMRLTRRVTSYKPELPRKLAALLPYKSQIKEDVLNLPRLTEDRSCVGYCRTSNCI